MTRTSRFGAAALAGAALTAAAAGQPIIGDLSHTSHDRSGRLRVQGAGFGPEGEGGRLVIGGVEAFVTQWADTQITGYVPEAAPLGPVDVQVVVGGAASDPALLTVTARQPEGRVLWRFAFDDNQSYHRCGVAPDGTIYVNDQAGRLYALAPDGALLWIVDTLLGQRGLGVEGPVVVGADGTAYVIAEPLGPEIWLQAWRPDGTLKWMVVEPDAQGAAAGPAIGPDGAIYAVFHDPLGPVLGAISVAPGGKINWSNPGSPALYEHGAVGSELSFAGPAPGAPADRVVVTVDHRSIDPRLYAFDLTDGRQLYAVVAGGAGDPIMQGQVVAAAGTGAVYISEFGAPGEGWGLQARAASDGERTWRFDPDVISGMTNPTVGADGTIYVAWDHSRIGAVGPDGAERWRHNTGGITQEPPMPDPGGEIVVVGGTPTFGVPGWIKGLDAATGDLLWTVDLPRENGGNVVPDASASFSPDRRTAYLPTTILAQDPENEYAYLYAIGTGLGGCDADCDGSGELDFFDFLCFQNQFAAGAPEADCDGSGSLDFFDFLCFQNAFAAGCR